jgi:hypothetical protein
MAKKLSLDDLKVQSFVTTLNADQTDQLVGGTRANGTCDTFTQICGCTRASNCCDTGDTQMDCGTLYTDTCGCTYVCTYENSYCNCSSPGEPGC